MVFQSSDREISTPSIVVASHVIEGMVKDIMTDPSDIDRETRDIILYWQQYSKGPTDDAKPLEPFDYKLFVQVNSPHADVYRPAIASVFRKITKDVNQRQQKLANNPVVKTIQSIKNFGNQAKQSYKEKFRLGKKRIRWGKDNKPAESTPQTPSETLAERIKFGDPETTLLQELEQALLHLEECSALAELIDQGFPSTQKGQDNEYIAYAQLYANFKQYQQLVPPNLPLTSTLQTRIANIGIKLDNHFRPGQS
jgi:hypothetical protein